MELMIPEYSSIQDVFLRGNDSASREFALEKDVPDINMTASATIAPIRRRNDGARHCGADWVNILAIDLIQPLSNEPVHAGEN